MNRISLKRLVNEVRHLDSRLSEKEDAFKCAVILLAAALVTGPNIKKVSKFTKYHESIVRRFVDNFRKDKLWGHKYIHASEWHDKKAGGVAFWLDVSVGLGFIKRIEGKNV